MSLTNILEAVALPHPWVGHVLDTPSALLRDSIVHHDPFHSTFDPAKRGNWRDVLEHVGAVGPNKPGLDLGDVAGFVLDNALDPVNLIGGAIVGKLGRKLLAVQKANKESKAMRALGFMPEEVAKQTKIVDDAGNPLKTYHGTKSVYEKYDPKFADKYAKVGEGHYSSADAGLGSEYAENVANPVHPRRGSLMRRRTRLEVELERVEARSAQKRAHRAIMDRYDRGDIDRKQAETLLGEADTRPLQFDSPTDAARHERLSSLHDKMNKVMTDLSVPRSNVRMQFIDSRKPFDLDKPISDLEFASLSGVHLHSIRPTETEINQLVDALHSDSRVKLSDVLPRFKAWPQSQETLRNFHSGTLSPERAKSLVISEIANDKPILGDALFKSMSSVDANHAIRRAGYDSIVHTGGQTMGDRPHQVVVAFHPDQIYKPYIAPALQRENHMPLAAVLAALGMHNAVVNPYRQSHGRDEEQER